MLLVLQRRTEETRILSMGPSWKALLRSKLAAYIVRLICSVAHYGLVSKFALSLTSSGDVGHRIWASQFDHAEKRTPDTPTEGDLRMESRTR